MQILQVKDFMEKTKITHLDRNVFLLKIQEICEQTKTPTCLVYIEINNAIQVARLLQGFKAEQELIEIIEKIIVKQTSNSGCSYKTKVNHHLFALVFDRPVQETVEIVEQLAAILDQKKIAIIDHENQNTEKTYFPKLNIGVTPLTPTYKKAELAVTAADEALYQARNVGNSIVKVVPPDNQRLHQYFDSLHSLPLLRAGLVEKSFVLYAQPIVPIVSQQGYFKAEVLLRYNDENGRIFPPKKFIHAATQFNVSREVDLYVIESFCQFMQGHQTETIYSINISGSTVRYPQFFNSVKTLLNKYRVNPEQVCFEITENVADKDYEQASQLMFKLKHELGCQLSLDDIGIGSSNLSNLPKFHVDYLKIDGYFVQNLLSDPYSEQVIRFISTSAKYLNKKTVAEYVEHAEERKKLQELGIDYIQGYLTGRPKLLFNPKDA